MWSASVLLAPVDVRPHPLLPAVEVLALLQVGVVRARSRRCRRRTGSTCGRARSGAGAPSGRCPRRSGARPGQVLGIAVLDPADVDEHDGLEAELLRGCRRRRSTSPLARRRTSAAAGLGGSSTCSPCTKRRKVCEVDRLVAGVRDHRHLLGEIVDLDAVGGVGLVGEVALRPDPVVERTGTASGPAAAAPRPLLLGGELDLRRGLRVRRARASTRALPQLQAGPRAQVRATSGIADTFIQDY